MKTLSIPVIAAAILIFGASFVMMPSHNTGSPGKAKPASISSIPDSIQKIFQKACLDCHADDGNSMARSHLNFTEWDSYSQDKKAAKGNDICKVLSKGFMPPKHFKQENPEVVPTQSQVEAICKWVSTLQK
jgi:cytochrome c5